MSTCKKCDYESVFVHCPCGWVPEDLGVKLPYIFRWAILDDIRLNIDLNIKTHTFIGNVGGGKTHSCWAIAKYLNWHINKKRASIIHCMSEPRLPSLLPDWLKPAEDREILILDELNSSDAIFSIVDSRVDSQNYTLCTTNQDINSLDPRIASRLKSGSIHIINNDDWRLNKEGLANKAIRRQLDFGDWCHFMETNKIKKAEAAKEKMKTANLSLADIQALPTWEQGEYLRLKKQKRKEDKYGV